MSPAEQLVEQLEQVLRELHHLAQQQQQALIALRLGAVEAVLAQQQSLLSRLAALEHECGEHLEEILASASLRQRWERGYRHLSCGGCCSSMPYWRSARSSTRQPSWRHWASPGHSTTSEPEG